MLKRIDLFVVTVCLFVQVSNADFVVRTDFDGGSARILDVDVNQGTIRFMPGGDANRGWTCWWAMRIEALDVGQQLLLELLSSDQLTRNQAKSRMPESQSFELARSRQDRPVLAWSSVSERADQKKSGVWIQARQHAWESGSSWVAQGFVDWLCQLIPKTMQLSESRSPYSRIRLPNA
jgi:hypothetical protein